MLDRFACLFLRVAMNACFGVLCMFFSFLVLNDLVDCLIADAATALLFSSMVPATT